MRIRNLYKSEYTGRWMWNAQLDENCSYYNEDYAPDKFPNTRTYRTDEEGKGLWEEKQGGRMVQIKSTCQFSVAGCKTKSGVYSAIRRYFKKLDAEGTEPFDQDFMQHIEQVYGYNRLTDEEKTYLKNHLSRLWSTGCITGAYSQRWDMLRHMVNMFIFGAGYRPGNNWREETA